MRKAETINSRCQTRCRNCEQSATGCRFQEKSTTHHKVGRRSEGNVGARKRDESSDRNVPTQDEKRSDQPMMMIMNKILD